MPRRRALIVGAAALSGCLVVVALTLFWTSRPTDRIPFQQTLIGATETPWIALGAGWYNMEVRQDSSGCSVPVRFSNQAANLAVYLYPYALGFGGGKIVGPTNWYGQTGALPAGTYRFVALAGANCEWSARLTRFVPPPSSSAR